MVERKQQSITIVGAGIAGCFLAILLAKRGYTVTIYERFTKEEIITHASKRSFNLIFYAFGVAALKEAGVWDKIEPLLVKAEGTNIQVSQKPRVHRTDRIDTPLYIIPRADVVKILIECANQFPSISFHFATSFVALNKRDRTMVVQDLEKKIYKTIPCHVIFGADGVNSQVRAFMQQFEATQHLQEYAQWEYKQISITKEQAQELQLQQNIIYIWTRKNCSILAHPNRDNSFNALFILPNNKEQGFASLTSEKAIHTLFTDQFTDLLPILPKLTKEIQENPVGNFVTIYTHPWYYKDFIAVIGDAAHGFLPFHGQGMSAAFGDALELAKLVDHYQDDWQQIFTQYETNRKPHMDALADLSKESLRTYARHKKADPVAVYNKLDTVLHQLFPRVFVALPASLLSDDPGRAAEYVEKHQRQRKRGKFLGVPFFVSAMTSLIALQENLEKYLKKSR